MTVFDEFSGNRIGRRLSTLPLLTPERDAAEILLWAPREGVRKARLARRLAVAAIATVAILAGIGYFAPAASQAMADAPIVGGPIGQALRSVGLASLSSQVTQMDSTASYAGYQLHLIGAYADGAVTVLLIRGQGTASPVLANGFITARDQFGRETLMSEGQGDFSTGVEVLTAPNLAWPDTVAGARLEVRVDTVLTPGSSLVRGQWVMTGIVIPSEWRSLPAPQPAKVGRDTVKYEKIGVSPSILYAKIDLGGATFDSAVQTGHTPHPYPWVELVGAAGSHSATLLGSGVNASPDGVEITALWPAPTRGTYRLIVHEAGDGGQSESSIVVP